MTQDEAEMKKEFCKDLCNELVIKGEHSPIYPPWAVTLALQMIRLGWTKGDARK